MIKRKQRFSLRKNKIGAMSVLLGISFVGAVASGSDVKANEISEEKAPKLIEKEVVGKTTKQDVEKAQAKVDASKEAESLKNKAIENKTTEINNNDNEISKIKADIERDKDATDENINKAEKKVESATEELKNKNSELVKTKAEKEERESELVLVKKDVADKSKDLETKQAKAKEIKDEIDGTENVTKKLETGKAKNEDIKKELETEKSNKLVADKELEKAKEFDAKLAEDTKNAEENLKAKQEELKAKTTDLDNAKKDEATKKAEYDAVVMPYGRNVKYKIALDQRFVDKFKEYMDYTLNWKQKGITMKEKFAKRAELREELKAIEKEINHEFLYNRYSHEDDYEIDLKNMSEEERLKMSQYGVYLLNQIRSQFGLEPLKVNKNSMQLAKEITETVMRDNHAKLNAGHYIKGISEVAAKHGLIREGNFYENLYNAGSTTFSDHKMSRNALYEHVYNSVMLFFYEGNITGGYGHAESLYKAKTPMGLGVAHFENVGDDYNVNRFPKEFIEKYKQYVEFDEFGNILDFKLIEFRKKDFRIAIDEKDSLFEYEVPKDIKNKRLEEIFNFFANFFKATTIKFKIANDKYEYYFHNNIEYYKFITLKQFLTQYTNLISNLRLYRYKNLSSAKNTLFELDLLDKSNSVEEANTWINAEIKSVIDVNIGDSLTIKRLHKMNFNDFPYDVEEIITLVHPLTKEEVKDNIIKLTRKSVKIKLRRVHK